MCRRPSLCKGIDLYYLRKCPELINPCVFRPTLWLLGESLVESQSLVTGLASSRGDEGMGLKVPADTATGHLNIKASSVTGSGFL